MPTRRPPSEDAGGSAEGRGGAPDAHGLGARRAGEGQQEQRHGGRAEGGGAGALDDAAADEQLLVGGDGREQGADGEQGRAADEHAAPAEQVRGPAGQQQQAAEGQDVGVDDPGEGGGAEAEVGLDGRQRDVDDGGVEHDDELGGHQQPEGDPAASVAGGPARRGVRRVVPVLVRVSRVADTVGSFGGHWLSACPRCRGMGVCSRR